MGQYFILLVCLSLSLWQRCYKIEYDWFLLIMVKNDLYYKLVLRVCIIYQYISIPNIFFILNRRKFLAKIGQIPPLSDKNSEYSQKQPNLRGNTLFSFERKSSSHQNLASTSRVCHVHLMNFQWWFFWPHIYIYIYI